MPAADVTIQLADYSFTPSTPLTSGHHVIRVENAGPQWHELVFVKLEPGKTPADFAAWVEKPEGPPPATSGIRCFSAQSGAVEHGRRSTSMAGEYGFLCFLPDAKDGKLHIVQGMIQQVAVK